MSKYSTKLLGFGDNVVDIYDHLKTMYPGGNCVNVSVYGKMAGCEKTAYMGYFGDDDRAELIMDTLEKIGVETVSSWILMMVVFVEKHRISLIVLIWNI